MGQGGARQGEGPQLSMPPPLFFFKKHEVKHRGSFPLPVFTIYGAYHCSFFVEKQEKTTFKPLIIPDLQSGISRGKRYFILQSKVSHLMKTISRHTLRKTAS